MGGNTLCGRIIARRHLLRRADLADLRRAHLVARARFTASVWSWEDGTDWDAYDHSNTDGMINTGETKLAITTDGKWHDWGTGASSLHVVCRLEDVVPTPAPTATS